MTTNDSSLTVADRANATLQIHRATVLFVPRRRAPEANQAFSLGPKCAWQRLTAALIRLEPSLPKAPGPK